MHSLSGTLPAAAWIHMHRFWTTYQLLDRSVLGYRSQGFTQRRRRRFSRGRLLHSIPQRGSAPSSEGVDRVGQNAHQGERIEATAVRGNYRYIAQAFVNVRLELLVQLSNRDGWKLDSHGFLLFAHGLMLHTN